MHTLKEIGVITTCRRAGTTVYSSAMRGETVPAAQVRLQKQKRLSWRLATPLVALVAGCMTTAQEPPSRPPLGSLAMVGIAQAAPTPKTPVNSASASLGPAATYATAAASLAPRALAKPSAKTPIAADIDKPAMTTLEQERNETREAIAAANSASLKQKTPGTGLKLDTNFGSAKRIVPFAFAAKGLGGHGKKMVAAFIPFAKEADRIYIRGRTDGSGNQHINQALAIARAVSVKAEFMARGVPKNKVKATYCTTCYIASNDTEAGRRANRRVEIELIMPADRVAKLPYPEAVDTPLVLASK